MKKYLKLTLLTFLILMISDVNALALDFEKDNEPVEISLPRMVNGIIKIERNENTKVENKVINYSNDYAAVNIHKPIVKTKNKAAEKKINEKIDKIINDFEENIVNLSKKDNKFNIDNLLEVRQYVVSINSNVNYNEDNILSITLSLYSYTGGAHGSTSDVSLNFDTNTGNVGVIKDFFENNPEYNEIILNKMKEIVAKDPNLYFKDVVEKYNTVPYNQKFYLTKDNLVIYFDEYEIAPYAAGRVEFKIPISSFPNGINKVNINEEVPTVKTIIKQENNSINEYLTYPCIENMENIEVEEKINSFFQREIDLFEGKINENDQGELIDHIKGITTYFNSKFENESTIVLNITYSGSSQDEREVVYYIKSYIVDLNTGEIKI